MAITVTIYYAGANGNAGRFAEERFVSGTVDAIRAKAGDLRYEYFSRCKIQKRYFCSIAGAMSSR